MTVPHGSAPARPGRGHCHAHPRPQPHDHLLRFGTYNIREYHHHLHHAEDRARYQLAEHVLRDTHADVWAIQELANPDALLHLAHATGMHCLIDGRPACDPGRGFGVGLLWRPGIRPVPGTLRVYTNDVYFHGLVQAHLVVHGITIRAAATHLTPWGAPPSIGEAKRTVAAMTRPHHAPPGIIGSDSNSISGDRVRLPCGREHWHAPDPYRQQRWHPDLVYQCCWTYDPDTGQRAHWADRSVGDVLCSGGLREVTAILRAPAAVTTGHAHDDPYPARAIDHIRVTTDLAPAVRAVAVCRTNAAKIASDHLPLIATLNLAALAA